MENQLWVEQVRALLARAKRHNRAAFADLEALKHSIDGALQDAQRKAPSSHRRRHLLAQVRLRIKHYALADEVQAFVLAAGHDVLESLDVEQLVALHTWLLRLVDDIGADDPFLRATG
jgi:hypothetical protein